MGGRTCSHMTQLWPCLAQFQPDPGHRPWIVNLAGTLDIAQPSGLQICPPKPSFNCVWLYTPNSVLRTRLSCKGGLGL